MLVQYIEVGRHATTVRIARDGAGLVGVSVYDPAHFDSSVVYQAGDPMPVIRRGDTFASFTLLLPPYAPPLACSPASFYVGASLGQATTDSASNTIVVPQVCFGTKALEYYQGTDGSPQADLPYPVPPEPAGVTSVTFGTGVVMVWVNFP